MSRYSIDGSTTLHPGGRLKLSLNTATGLTQNDFFKVPTDHLDATNLAAYSAARPSNPVSDRHMTQLAASPIARVRWIVGSDVYVICDDATFASWLLAANNVSPDFLKTLLPRFGTFEEAFGQFMTDGSIDPAKWIMGEGYNPLAPTAFSTHSIRQTPYAVIDGMSEQMRLAWDETDPQKMFPAGQVTTSQDYDAHTTVFTQYNGGVKHYGLGTEYGTLPAVLGVRVIWLQPTDDLVQTPNHATAPYQCHMIPWPGYEGLVQQLADRLGAVMVPADNLSTARGTFVTISNAEYTAMDAAFVQSAASPGSHANFGPEMAWVGRPFGTSKPMIIGKTAGLTARTGSALDESLTATASMFYSLSFAQMAGANRALAAITSDATRSTNLISAAEALEAKPTNIVGGCLLEAAVTIPSNELHTSQIWDDLTDAGVNVGAEMAGSEPISSVVTRLNGLMTLNALSVVAVEDYVIPEVGNYLPILRNPGNYTINVTGADPTWGWQLREDNVPVEGTETWFTVNAAATMFATGSILTTTDGADLAAAAIVLNGLVGGIVDVTDPVYQLAPDHFHAAGLPLYHSYLGASDYRARAHFVLKGLEQKGLTAQMRALAEALQANRS